MHSAIGVNGKAGLGRRVESIGGMGARERSKLCVSLVLSDMSSIRSRWGGVCPEGSLSRVRALVVITFFTFSRI